MKVVRSFTIFTFMSFVIILMLCGFCYGQDSVKDYYNRELINDMRLIESVKGSLQINKIQIPDDNGNVSECIELVAEDQAFTGRVGVTIPLPDLPWWWQFANWWQIDIEAVWTPTRATSDFVLECVDENGDSIERIKLIERPAPVILGTPIADIPSITNNMTPKHYNFPLVAVPKAKTSDPSKKSKKANLVIWFTDWFGKVRIKSLKVKPFEFTKELQEQWKVEGVHTFGGLPWFEPAYLGSPTAISETETVIHPTLRDTGHKLLAATGMKSMRYFLLWDKIESVKGQYDFKAVDKLIDELEYYGMKMGFVTVHGVPDWAVSKTLEDVPDGLAARKATWKVIFPPDNWADYEGFVRKLVSHFKSKVGVWEVWNEPNSHVWGVKSPYKSYEQFLIRFYTQAKSVDPDCKVFCGRVGWWINAMLREGMAEYMDGLTLHPYPGSHGGNVEHVMRQFREVQLALMAADEKMPIEVTEFGFGSSYPWTGPGAQNGEQAKAEMLYNALTAMKEVTNSVYWYTPIQANRQYGIIQFESDRYRPVDSYWAFGKVTGELAEKEGVVKASVVFSDKFVSRGRKMKVKLVAENTSNKAQEISFWPIGFVDSLGIESLEDIRKHDWHGVLKPGQKYETIITVRPQERSYGRYPVGLVIMNDLGNTVQLQDIWIKSIASSSKITASSCDFGGSEVVNDLLVPVWSGDEDVPALIWRAKPQKRQEWVQMDFGDNKEISEVEFYWFADPKPHYPFKGRKPKYIDKIIRLSEKDLMDAHGMELGNPAEDIKIENNEYDNFRLPESWELFCRNDNGQWVPIAQSDNYPTEANQFNMIGFDEIKTSALKLTVDLTENKGGGVHEWRVK